MDSSLRQFYLDHRDEILQDWYRQSRWYEMPAELPAAVWLTSQQASAVALLDRIPRPADQNKAARLLVDLAESSSAFVGVVDLAVSLAESVTSVPQRDEAFAGLAVVVANMDVDFAFRLVGRIDSAWDRLVCLVDIARVAPESSLGSLVAALAEVLQQVADLGPLDVRLATSVVALLAEVVDDLDLVVSLWLASSSACVVGGLTDAGIEVMSVVRRLGSAELVERTLQMFRAAVENVDDADERAEWKADLASGQARKGALIRPAERVRCLVEEQGQNVVRSRVAGIMVDLGLQERMLVAGAGQLGQCQHEYVGRLFEGCSNRWEAASSGAVARGRVPAASVATILQQLLEGALVGGESFFFSIDNDIGRPDRAASLLAEGDPEQSTHYHLALQDPEVRAASLYHLSRAEAVGFDEGRVLALAAGPYYRPRILFELGEQLWGQDRSAAQRCLVEAMAQPRWFTSLRRSTVISEVVGEILTSVEAEPVGSWLGGTDEETEAGF